mgnify:CR=1 FL=1
MLCDMLLKIVSWGTYHIIMEFPTIFNANLRLIWAECFLRNSLSHCIQVSCDNLLYATDWFSAILVFHGPILWSLTNPHTAYISDHDIIPGPFSVFSAFSKGLQNLSAAVWERWKLCVFLETACSEDWQLQDEIDRRRICSPDTPRHCV